MYNDYEALLRGGNLAVVFLINNLCFTWVFYETGSRDLTERIYCYIFGNDHLYVNLLIILFTKINKYVIKVIYSEEISRVIVRVRRVKLDLSSGSIINMWNQAHGSSQSCWIWICLRSYGTFSFGLISASLSRDIFVTVNTAFQWERCTVVKFSKLVMNQIRSTDRTACFE